MARYTSQCFQEFIQIQRILRDVSPLIFPSMVEPNYGVTTNSVKDRSDKDKFIPNASVLKERDKNR